MGFTRVQKICTKKSLEVRWMKITTLERIFICVTTLVLNKALLFWLIAADNMLVMLSIFTVLVLNFVILAKSVDKLIEVYEQTRKEQAEPHIEM